VISGPVGPGKLLVGAVSSSFGAEEDFLRKRMNLLTQESPNLLPQASNDRHLGKHKIVTTKKLCD